MVGSPVFRSGFWTHSAGSVRVGAHGTVVVEVRRGVPERVSAGEGYQVGGVDTQIAVHSSVSEGFTYQWGMLDAYRIESPAWSR